MHKTLHNISRGGGRVGGGAGSPSCLYLRAPMAGDDRDSGSNCST